VYDRTIDGQALLFGNTSALYESDMVMLDHQTGSYWMQVSGKAIVGTLTGERMQLLPSQTTTWGLWKEQHPETLSLSRETGYGRDYDYNPFIGFGERLNATGQFIFPVSENGRDPRLEPGEVVLAVEVAGMQRAYAIERLGDGVIEDEIGGSAVVVFSSRDGPTGAAYRPIVEGRRLTFAYVDGAYVDEQTGGTWSLSGAAIKGEFVGAQLESLPSRSTFWFSIVATFPDIELYMGE
jgi:hypothetical protein